MRILHQGAIANIRDDRGTMAGLSFLTIWSRWIWCTTSRLPII